MSFSRCKTADQFSLAFLCLTVRRSPTADWQQYLYLYDINTCFRVIQSIQQLLSASADELLLTERKHNPGHVDVLPKITCPMCCPKIMLHIVFKFLTFQLNNLRWGIGQCDQQNKEEKGSWIWCICHKLFKGERNQGDWLEMGKELVVRICSWW